jgi:hypothetical protein
VIEAPMFGFGFIYKYDKWWVQGHLIVECIWHKFSTQIEDQDQNQEEDEV